MPSAASKSTRVITIAVVENDPLRFVGFRSIFESEPDFSVRSVDASSILADSASDVILLGSRDASAMQQTLAALKSVRPGVKVIVTGSSNHEDDILRAVSAGAKGYVHESASSAEYKQAIRVVHSGSVWAPRRVLSRFIEMATATGGKPLPKDPSVFSERERQVLKLLVGGLTNREIGQQLGIEERTVKAYIARLMQKVGVNNRIALSVHALTNALLGGHV